MKPEFSPLFWPVIFKRDHLLVLDETLLPAKTSYIRVTDYRQACRVIKEMKTRAVGQVILVFYTFLLVAHQKKGAKNMMPFLRKVAEGLVATRPTLAFRYLTDMVLGWAWQTPEAFEKDIEKFLALLRQKRIGQAQAASRLLKDKDTVLTHCNVSGLMPLIASFARGAGKRIDFLVTETRPYLQGARLSAWELTRQGFKVTVIADNTVAQVMHEGKVNKVIVGADHLAQNGDIANKIGTYQIALLARQFKIPFYVLCPPASQVSSGKDIPIEIRPQEELLVFKGERLAPKEAVGYYPAFDITPAQLITKHIHLEVSR